MPLVTTTEMFRKAYEGGYAIGAFNVNNMEIVQGITEAAKEANKFVIGVDKDQYEQAPDNMLSSASKKGDEAVITISKESADGKKIGGKNIELGMSDGAVGISTHHEHMDDAVYTDATDLVDQIKNKKIDVPGTKDEFDKFVKSL